MRGTTSNLVVHLPVLAAVCLIGPHCIKMIGCKPSRRMGVAVRPSTYGLLWSFSGSRSKEIALHADAHPLSLTIVFSKRINLWPLRESDCITTMSILPVGLNLPPKKCQ